MAVTVIDNTNPEQLLADATGEPFEQKTAETIAAGADEKKIEGSEPKPTDADIEDADDIEGDDGTTARQKRELSQRMLKAIGKKHRQVKEAEEFAADQIRIRREAEERAAELEQRLKRIEAQGKPAAEQPKDEGKPARENFAKEEEYLEAMIDWRADQKFAQKEVERLRKEAQARVNSEVERAAGLVPDFRAVAAAAAPKIDDMVPAVAKAIQDSPLFPELFYHLAKNPETIASLAKMSEVRQLVALGKIEATLQPFGSKAPQAAPKEPEQGDTNGKGAKPAPSSDTGFTPSKARSDAPVINPLKSGNGQQVEPDVRTADVRTHIQEFQRSKGVNLHARKRH